MLRGLRELVRRRNLFSVGIPLIILLSAAQVSAADPLPWGPNTSYAKGTQVTFSSITYACQQAHTSVVGWEPPITPALWQRPTPTTLGPWTSQTIYPVNTKVTYSGLPYTCIQGHNSVSTWTPPATPALWKCSD